MIMDKGTIWAVRDLRAPGKVEGKFSVEFEYSTGEPDSDQLLASVRVVASSPEEAEIRAYPRIARLCQVAEERIAPETLGYMVSWRDKDGNLYTQHHPAIKFKTVQDLCSELINEGYRRVEFFDYVKIGSFSVTRMSEAQPIGAL